MYSLLSIGYHGKLDYIHRISLKFEHVKLSDRVNLIDPTILRRTCFRINLNIRARNELSVQLVSSLSIAFIISVFSKLIRLGSRKSTC